MTRTAASWLVVQFNLLVLALWDLQKYFWRGRAFRQPTLGASSNDAIKNLSLGILEASIPNRVALDQPLPLPELRFSLTKGAMLIVLL